jgi:hypothetical protein
MGLQIVGVSVGGSQQAFVYQIASATLQNLNDLLAPGAAANLLSANGVNDTGSIAATGTFNGHQDALLLTRVVPEPSTFALMLGASVLVAFGAWLRRTRAMRCLSARHT